MRTTILLDDHLARQAKRRAVQRGITLSQLVSEALRMALVEPQGAVASFEMVTYGAGLPGTHREPGDLTVDDEEDRRALGG